MGDKKPFRHAEMMSGLMEIRFDYNPDVLFLVKKFEGRRWISENKVWTAPLDLDSIESLREMGFQIGKELERWEQKHKPLTPEENEPIPGLKCVLLPYQQQGVARIRSFHDRALLADDMGLGKTAQAIAWLQLHRHARPAVILCPASLKEMWRRKILEWMEGEQVVLLDGKTPDAKTLQVSGKAPIYVLNYEILGNKITIKETPTGKKKRVEEPFTGWIDYLMEKGIKAVVADEAHYLKNAKTQRGLAGGKLLKGTRMALCLTGTPIENRPVEFWPLLSVLVPHQFRNFMKFAKRYCGAYHNGFGWDFSGSSHADELNDVLSKCVMIRRLKKDVLTELPAKRRAVVPLPLSTKERREYLKIETSLLAVGDDDKINALTKLAALRQAAAMAKLDSACRWIEDFLESGQKLIVFAHHHAVVNALRDRLGKVTKIAEITGQTTGSRQEQEDMFQNDPKCRLFIGSKSAKEGLTLTAASNVAFVEFFDTPGQMAQAEDRCHRIGQNESVTAWYLTAEDTVEEDMAALLDKKMKVLKQVLDGEVAEKGDLLLELMKAAQKWAEGRKKK